MTADNNAIPDVDCPNCGLGQNVQDRFGRNDFEIKTTCSHCKKPFVCYTELKYFAKKMQNGAEEK
jgi:hypothetical protein